MISPLFFTAPSAASAAAAVAACRAIEACTDAKPEIKWVNDVFVNGKKVCGILTEASVNFETGLPDWIVTGIGFNVYPPKQGFPKEIAKIAGAITEQRQNNLRAKLASGFIDSFYESGFDTETARDHGEVHPDEEWKEKIAAFVAGKIRETLKI